MATNYIVRYGTTRIVGEFASRSSHAFARNTEVIVRSERGVEWGEVLCAATARTREFLGQSDNVGRILREATQEDHRMRDKLQAQEREQFSGCQEMINERKLQMQLVDVEQVFGGERLVFYYLAEKRVDFRELVKALAKRFRSRIEMRQIGVRDEARLLADYGDCGKPVCCNTHLREMPPVSMKMAKLQKATLDPTKISGRCGRLKCCLRYEFDTYEEYRRELPKVGAMIVTKTGQGKVIAQDILARKVLMIAEDGRRVLVDGEDVVTIVKKSDLRKPDVPRDAVSQQVSPVEQVQSPADATGDSASKTATESAQAPGRPAGKPARRSRRGPDRSTARRESRDATDAGTAETGPAAVPEASTESPAQDAQAKAENTDSTAKGSGRRSRSRGDRKRSRGGNRRRSSGKPSGEPEKEN